MNLLLFNIGDYKFGIETKFIRRIQKIQKIEPIPGKLNNIIGLINYEGNIISVINLQYFIHFNKINVPCTGLILESNYKIFAILTDNIIEVISNMNNKSLKNIDESFLKSHFDFNNETYILIDPGKLCYTENQVDINKLNIQRKKTVQ